jgi:hypothetical protein
MVEMVTVGEAGKLGEGDLSRGACALRQHSQPTVGALRDCGAAGVK